MFILSNLNISTTTIGINTSITVSKMFIAGNTGILNIFLNAGTNNTISISPADTAVASISLLLLNIPVLNIDFLLFLILNTCTNSESAKTVNAFDFFCR